MSITTISTKGQITLPVRFRRKLGLKPGDRVVMDESDDQLIIRKPLDIFKFKGFLGKALPAEKERKLMDKGVADHVNEFRGRR